MALTLGACSGSAVVPTEPSPHEAATTTISDPSVTSTSRPAEPGPQWGRLAVIGDWGSGKQEQFDVASAMARNFSGIEVTAILTTGDNFYSDDETALMEPYEWAVDSGIPFWVSWGNHDIESNERIADVNTVFGDPARWTVIPWGEVDVVILDSNDVDSEPQKRFFADSLSTSTRPTILVFHHPAYSCSRHGDTTDVIDSWVPLFDEQVVLVLNGHDHNYQRFQENGVTYVVTGGGGRPVYDLDSCPAGHPARVAGEAVHHFLSVKQTGDSLVVEAIDTGGKVIDSFEVALPS